MSKSDIEIEYILSCTGMDEREKELMGEMEKERPDLFEEFINKFKERAQEKINIYQLKNYPQDIKKEKISVEDLSNILVKQFMKLLDEEFILEIDSQTETKKQVYDLALMNVKNDIIDLLENQK